MISIRNADNALTLSVRAADSDLKSGMVVKLAQGANSGDQPTVTKASATDIADNTVVKGVVLWETTDSQDVDFIIDPTTQNLTQAGQQFTGATTIPLNAQCTIVLGRFVIAYHKLMLGADLDPATVREGTQKVAFSGTTHLPAAYASGATDGTQVVKGVVYRIDGPEVTLLVEFPVAN